MGLTNFKLLKHKLVPVLLTLFIQNRLVVVLLFLVVVLNPHCCKGLKSLPMKSEIEAACLVFKLILKLVFHSWQAPDI